MSKSKIKTYQNFIHGLLKPKTPGYLILYVNNICQMHCNMCFYWQHLQEKKDQLSLEEIKEIASGFGNLLQLTLTGGEPSLREDLAKIPGIFSKRSNLSKCTVVTNGFLSERIYEQASEMVKENPDIDFRYFISIDSIGKDHDLIRGMQGSFEKALATIKLLSGLRAQVDNLCVEASTVISKDNYNTIGELFNYLKDHCALDNHSFSYVRGTPKEIDLKNVPRFVYPRIKDIFRRVDAGRSQPFFQKLITLIRELVEDEVQRELNSQEYRYPCSAGRRFLEIYSDGTVIPCEILETFLDNPHEAVLGNIKDFDYNISKLLKSKKAQKLTDYIHASECHCTFECPKYTNILYDLRFYPRIFKGLIRQLLKN